MVLRALAEIRSVTDRAAVEKVLAAEGVLEDTQMSVAILADLARHLLRGGPREGTEDELGDQQTVVEEAFSRDTTYPGEGTSCRSRATS